VAADLERALQNLWSNDFVQKNPRKSYQGYYAGEYDKVAAYINGGPRPDPANFSKLGKGLVEVEDKIREGVTVPPPERTYSSSIEDGDTVPNGTTWTITAEPPPDSVEFWVDGV
jgi:hypothetical protein